VSYQENLIAATKKAVDDLFRSARAVPADKLEWSPLDQGRTVLDQLQEVSAAPMWFAQMLIKRVPPPMTPEDFQKGREARKQWKTIDECEKACAENGEALYAAMLAVPEADFKQTITMPFGEGFTLTLMEVMAMHHWNVVYHYGQISYVQTLYGDKEMH
jgi:hypothetical protein